MSITASKDYGKRTMGHGRVSDVEPSETVSESQGKNLRAFEKRDFKGIKASSFKPREWRDFEDYIAKRDEKSGAAGMYGLSPEQRIAKVCPNFVDDAIKGVRANGSYHLPNADDADLYLTGFSKANTFRVVRFARHNLPLRVFKSEAQARDFLQRYIYASADASKAIAYPYAAARGIFKDAQGLSAEDAYVRDASYEVNVDGVVIRAEKKPEECREEFRRMYEAAKTTVDADRAVADVLGKRDFDSMDDFKRWLERNSDAVARKYDEIKDEYNKELHGEFERKWKNMEQGARNAKDAVEAQIKELARRQQHWLDNNVEDLARLYKARIKEEEDFDFEDEVDGGDGLDWEDGGDDGFGAPANVNEGNIRKSGKFTLKLKERIAEFIDELKGRILNEEQAGIASVVRGHKNYYHIRIDDLGNVIAFLRGSRDKSGANHIMLKHYGENARMGYVSADEILQIGEIIRSGRLEIVNENERCYWIADPNYDGRRLTVVVKKSFKKKQPDFVLTFYSNKKAEEVRAKKQASGATHSVLSSSTLRSPSENASESQGKNSSGGENNPFGSSGGGRMESSTNPYPPDLTMPKDDRFDPKRVDSSPRKDYDAGAAQAAFDGVWDTLGNVKRGYSSAQIREVEAKMRDFRKKMDARMLELPELIEFAERIISGKVRAVKGFKRDYLGMYYGGEKKIELRRDLFKLVGDCRRYEVALDAAREVLKKRGFNPEIIDSRRPDQIVQAVYENRLGIEYQIAFERKINVEFGKAKRNV